MYTLYDTYVLRQSDDAAIPMDAGNSDYQAYLAWKDAGNTPLLPAGPTFDERKAILLAAVDAHLNAAARAKGYDSILSASLRAALPASAFHAEGVAFGTWMDDTYAKCYDVLAKVQAEEISEPTQAELIAMLPALVLPA